MLLSLALVLSLAACGGEATPDASDDAPASSQNEESTENDNTENQIVFEEVVAIDNAECAVKITEIDPDNMWGYTLKAQLENKSTEKTYMFSVESASINGVQCDPMFASEVAAGKKANEEINFSTDTLEENGIVEYTDIELTFKVYDSNDWSADPVGKETIHVYPYGEENAVAFVREAQATDNVIIDNYSNNNNIIPQQGDYFQTEVAALFFTKIKRRATMSKKKPPTTIEECNAEMELTQKKIRQYENRNKMLDRKLAIEKRKERNHRLCSRGGYLESLVPALIDMSEQEARDFLYTAVFSDKAQEFLRKRAGEATPKNYPCTQGRTYTP